MRKEGAAQSLGRVRLFVCEKIPVEQCASRRPPGRKTRIISLFSSALLVCLIVVAQVAICVHPAEGTSQAARPARPNGAGGADSAQDCYERRLRIELPGGLPPIDVSHIVLEGAAGRVASAPAPAEPPTELGPPFEIGGSLSYAPGPYNEDHPSVVFDGTHYFVVWQDTRQGSYNLYGARVDTSGHVLDPGGITISAATGDQYRPVVSFDGTNYFVVWQDSRNSGGSTTWDIYGARVTTSGELLDPGGIEVSMATSHQWGPDVAFDGTDYFVVWADARHTGNEVYSDIYAARVDTSGSVLDPDGIAVSTADEMQHFPVVAFDGTRHLVVWQDTRDGSCDIYGARVATSGTVLDSAGLVISACVNLQYYPAVASDGHKFMVVWIGYSEATDWDIYGARVDTSGAVLDVDSIAVSTAANIQGWPDVVADGEDFLVTWEDSRSGARNIYGARVDTSGSVLDPGGIPISTESNIQNYPVVAFDGLKYLVVWQDYRAGSWNVYGTRVGASGNVIDAENIPIALALVAGDDQYYPTVAFDGTNYLVAWSNYRSGTWDIWGVRVDPDGNILDSLCITVSTGSADKLYPDAVFDGTNYFLVWQDHRLGTWDIYGARVDTSGNVLDPGGIAVSAAADDQFWPAVAFDGTNHMVVWEDRRSGAWEIYGARVDTSGAVLDADGIAISTEPGEKYWPAVDSDGTRCLVVWADSRDGSWDIYGARVDTSGAVLDSGGMPISTASGDQFVPAVCSGERDWFVAWADKRFGTWDIFGTRMDEAGCVLDAEGIVVSTGLNDQYWPSIAFDGSVYMVVWEDNRRGTQYWDVFGARVTSGAMVLDPEGLELTSDLYPQQYPAVAAGPLSRMLITYQSFLPAGTCGTYLIWGNIWSGEPISVPEGPLTARHRIHQNFPNPFNPVCTILFEIPDACPVSLRVFDVAGSLVRTLVNEKRPRGVHKETWDGKGERGREMSSGVYFYELRAGTFRGVRKMVLLR